MPAAPWTRQSDRSILLLVHKSSTESLEKILGNVFFRSSPGDLIATNWPLQNSGNSWTRKLGWRWGGNFYQRSWVKCRVSYANTELMLPDLLQDPQRSRQDSSLLNQRIKPERVAALRDTRNLGLGFQQANQEQETSPYICSRWLFGNETPPSPRPLKWRPSGGRCPHSHLLRTVLVYVCCLCVITSSTCFPLRNTQAWTVSDIVTLFKAGLVQGWARKEKASSCWETETENLSWPCLET